MSKNNRFFDEEWKAKKVFQVYEKRQNTTYTFKNNPNYHSYSRATKNVRNTEVVVKITSSSKNFTALKNHLNYISRKGSLDLVDSDYGVYSDKQGVDDIADNFNVVYNIPTKNEILNFRMKEKRETFNIVFSMKEHSSAPTTKIRLAAINTLKKKFPNNYFVIAMHNDTDNPHCHICMKVVDSYGKRLNIRKSDLNEIRREFAKELRALNVEATATIKKKVNIETGKEIEEDIYIKDDGATKFEKHKAHHYRVIDFGEANYGFKKDNPMSFYVKYRTRKGKDVILWSNDLQRVIEKNNIQKNEYCRFAIIDEKLVNVKEQKIIKRDDKKYVQVIEKKAYKKIWDVSIENRLEKKLNPISNFTPTQSNVVNEYEYHKANHYEVLSFGKANYKFDINNSESFYVKYRTKNGNEAEIWNKDLERVIKENGVMVGDYCRFAVVGDEPYEFILKDKDTNLSYLKRDYRKIWDVSIENRLEKKLPTFKQRNAEFTVIYPQDNTTTKNQAKEVNKANNSGGLNIKKDEPLRKIDLDIKREKKIDKDIK